MDMNNQQGFSGIGHWYKGNLHSHTTNSDGCLTPEQSVALFREHGYHFLCLSEHDKYTDYRSQFDCEDFILLPGLEASALLFAKEGDTCPIKVHHMHGILGTEEMQRQAQSLFVHGEVLPPPAYYGSWDGARAAQELSDALHRRGCLVTYNHPIWSRVRESEFMDTKGVFALEIFNYNTVNESGTGYDTTHWETMLREGKRIFALATDDNHNGGVFDDACGGFIMVQAESLTHENIIQALLSGNYYSSSGPEIYDWGVRDGVAYVECSPVNRVNFVAGDLVGDGATVLCKNIDETLTRAEWKMRGHERYLRVECIDKHGKTAWSNPIWL